jgi:anaerobic selenocysteine-containing dehydrogenase
VPGLGARLGRGGATTAENDLANADCIIIMGSNMAENHPVCFRFVMKAREQGARIIHIDPASHVPRRWPISMSASVPARTSPFWVG